MTVIDEIAAERKRPGSSEGEMASLTQFNVFQKAGPLRNGAQRGGGTVWHAVTSPADHGLKAICGAQPSIQWSCWSPPGQQVTCPKCLKKVAALKSRASQSEDEA